jgi:glucan phosphoethanolaminetransferase (alkaline phosphatase superfamily)
VSTSVFETFMGLPLHPLVIHAAVVFIPLLVAGALAFALVPRLRPRIDWAVAALAVVAPLSALLAKLSGDAFRARVARNHMPAATLVKIDEHGGFATITLSLTVALGLVVLALVFIRRRPVVLSGVLVVAAVVLAVVTGYYVFRTGDSAAHIVWNGS